MRILLSPKIIFLLTICIIALFAFNANAATEQISASTGTPTAPESGGSLELPLSLALTLGSTTGFQKENPLYVMSFIGTMNYTLPAEVMATLDGGFSKEMTNSDATIMRRETEFSDLGLGFAREIYIIPLVQMQLSFSSRFNFPTSKPSRAQTLYLGWTNGVSVSKSLYGFSLGYSFGFKKNFHEFNTGEIKQKEEGEAADSRGQTFAEALGENIGQTPFIIVNRSGDLLNTGRANTSYSFINTFMVTYSFIEELSANVTLSVNNGRAYQVEDTVIYVNDMPQTIEGSDRGERDLFITQIALSYTPWQYLNFSTGIQTITPQLKPDSKGYYNPFFVNNYDNMSTFFLNLTGMI
jgi:hypothetical protein